MTRQLKVHDNDKIRFIGNPDEYPSYGETKISQDVIYTVAWSEFEYDGSTRFYIKELPKDYFYWCDQLFEIVSKEDYAIAFTDEDLMLFICDYGKLLGL